MLRSKIALAGAGVLAGIGLTLATFGATASPAGADEHDNSMLMAQKAQVIASTFQLDQSDLHDIDVAASEGTIAPGALGTVRRARIAIQATEWPEALKPMAVEQVEAMKALEEAIRTEDATRVSEPAKKVHDLGHDLSGAVYTWLDTGAAPEGGHGH